MPENSADVVIAGGGPNGLMLAAELALAGLRPLVLERLTEPSAEPKANGLVGQVVRLMDMRGLYGRIGRDAATVATAPYAPPGTTSPVPRPLPGYQFGGLPLNLGFDGNPLYALLVPQPELVRQLDRHARQLGAEIRWGQEVVDFAQHPDGVEVTVAGPDGIYQLRSPFLVAADGGRSGVRKLLGVDFPGFTSDSVTRAGHIQVSDELRNSTGGLDIPGFGSLRFGHNRLDRGIVAFAMLEPGRPLLSVTEYTGGRDDSADPMTFAELSAAAHRVLGVELPMRPPTGPGPHALRRIAGQNTRLVENYRVDNVLLLGDAAHVHSGMGGPGLNLGLQDAVNLGWKLAAVVKGSAPEGLLDTYQSERHPVGERVMMQSLAQTALAHPGPEVSALRDLFTELLEFPPVTAHIAHLMAGSDVRYETGCDHPMAGRLAPDLTLTTAAGTRRLADLLHPAHPICVEFSGGTVLSAVADGWSDRVDTVTAGCPETTATALLIRPDGYVAWASDTGRADGLTDALTRWFGPPRRR